MIFVTVGAQMPFDRLISAVDRWAHARGRRDVFAQIGMTDYRPKHIEWTSMLDPSTFKARCQEADLIVAHAGTGSIISALHFCKPLVVMPRRAHLGETRNDHQVATARQFIKFDSITVAQDENELPSRLEQSLSVRGRCGIGPYASSELIQTVQAFLQHPDCAPPPDSRRPGHLAG